MKWCEDRGAWTNHSARTAYLLQAGYQTLREGSLIVILVPQHLNAAAWKRKYRQIKVLSVHRASDDARVFV